MKVEMRVEKSGRVIFRAQYDTGAGGFAELSKMALEQFRKDHPKVSLLDEDVWVKWDNAK